MTNFTTSYCGAPVNHWPHGFTVVGLGNIPYLITCPGRQHEPEKKGPIGVVGK